MAIENPDINEWQQIAYKFAEAFKENNTSSSQSSSGDPLERKETLARKKRIKADEDDAKFKKEANGQAYKDLKKLINLKATHKAQMKEANDLRRKANNILDDKNAKNMHMLRAHQMEVSAKEELIAGQQKLAQITPGVSGAFKRLHEKVKSNIRSFGSATTAIGFFVAAAKAAHGDIKKQFEFGQIGTSVTGTMTDALTLGIDPSMISELQAKNRAAVIAMGGPGGWQEAMENARAGLYAYTGSNEASIQITQDAMTHLRRAGITPTTEVLVDNNKKLTSLGQTYEDIKKVSGATWAETNAMVGEFLATEEQRVKLAAATTDKQRRAVVAEITQRHKLLLGLGYMGEQATEAAKALDKLSGEGPRERFKKAAKAQAAFGMAGMGAEGQEVANLIRLGHRKTPEQNARLAELMSDYQKKALSSQTDSYAQEFSQMTMYQKAGMDQFSGFMNLATDDQKAETKNAERWKNISGTNKEMAGFLSNIDLAIAGLWKNPFGLAVTGLLSTIVGLLAWGKIGGFIKGLFKGGGGIIKGLFTGLKGILGSVMSGIGGMFSKGAGLMKSAILGGFNLVTKAGGLLQGIGGKLLSGIGTGLKAVAKTAILAPIYAVGKAAVEMWSESSIESARRSAEIFGKAGDSFLGDLGNRTISAFRHIGDNILGIFGLSGKDIGGSIGSSIYEFFHGKSDNQMVNRKSSQYEIQSHRVSRWAKESGTRAKNLNYTDIEKRLTGELAAGFSNVVETGGTLYNAKDAENPQLNDIRVLLKELNVTSAQAGKLTQQHMNIAAEMAADGKITQAEMEKWRKEMKKLEFSDA